MRNVLVQKSYTILKGDGVYAYHNGKPHLLTAPPPESISPEKDLPDVPAFAHYGNGVPHGDGHQGMGEMIKGKFIRGKHGEIAYNDGTYDHHHGIDGVIANVGRALERHNLLGKQHPQLGELTAKNIVQTAIERDNNLHEDESGFHHSPNVDSMEWRKIIASGFTGRESSRRPNRAQNGDFITTFTNRLNPKEKIGAMIESYSVPFNNSLQNILVKELGLKDMVNVEWLKNNYISIDDLHPGGRRLKGRGGDKIGQYGNLPASHLKNSPAGVVHEAAHMGVQSWETTMHDPDFFHMTLNRQQVGPKNSRESAKIHIAEAMKVLDPEKIPNVDVPINTTPGTIGVPQYSMQPLRTVLRDPTLLDNMVTELSKTPAFQKLFGRINSGSAAKPGPGRRAFEHLLDTFGGDPDGDGPQFDAMASHVTHGGHLESEDGSIPTKKLGTHANAAKFFSKVMLSGSHEKGTSAMRHYMPDEATLQSLGLSLPSLNTAGQRRQATQALSDIMVEAFGGTHRELPKEIPKGALASSVVQGYPDQLIEGLPSHIPFHPDIAMPPVRRAPDTRPTHTREHIQKPTQGGVATPSPSEPSQIKPPIRVAPSLPQGQMTLDQFQQKPQFPKPLDPSFQAARQQFGQAPPEKIRPMMREINPAGLNVGQPGTPLSPYEQRYHSSMGDPRQQLLSQYMKSISQDLSPIDRVMKAMELMQIDDAKQDDNVMKHALVRQINIADLHGINHLAKSVDLTPVDVRSIAHSTGDWERIAKRLNVSSDQVKVVKLSIGGI